MKLFYHFVKALFSAFIENLLSASLLRVLSLLLLMAFSVSARAQVDEVGSHSLKMNINGSILRIPYFADFQLDSSNTAIKKIVVVVHGMNRNAGDYYRNMKEAASMSSHYTDSLMVVAPQFLEEEDLDPNFLDNSYLYWSSGWKSGSNSKNNSGHPRPERISSYAVMDTLMMRLATFHPNLKFIILAGHSAGAQLVNRYSAASPVTDILWNKYGIHVRFIVANPSSYLYLDNERAIAGTVNQFAVPSTTCSTYNNWRYGLDKLYSYPNQFGADSIRNMMKRREVVYLLGELDTDETSSSLDQSCQAELQGSYRLERGTIYFNYLKHYYGESITSLQYRDTVPGAGHNNRDMFTSSIGRYWLFMSDPAEGPASVLFHTNNKLKVYPNPANDFIHIQLDDHVKPTYYSVYNAMGTILVKHQLLKERPCVLDLKDLKPGMYLLVIKTKQETIRKWFIKR